jgi:hypothetical protein
MWKGKRTSIIDSSLDLRLPLLLVAPVGVLHIANLEEVIRIGAADTQNRADALAVLLLARKALGVRLALFACVLPVRCVS